MSLAPAPPSQTLKPLQLNSMYRLRQGSPQRPNRLSHQLIQQGLLTSGR